MAVWVEHAAELARRGHRLVREAQRMPDGRAAGLATRYR
jgi:hypothetical protein